jgi:BlaI family transcriptional regulator, penicillinase repressor
MSSGKSPLTGQELEIMKVIWKLGPATVRQVYETLLERRKIAYTTVMTMMNILEQKGFLKKRADEKAYVYAPSRPEKQVIQAMVRDFVDRVFNGAAEPLLLHLLEDEKLTRQELDEVRRSIRQAESRKKS